MLILFLMLILRSSLAFRCRPTMIACHSLRRADELIALQKLLPSLGDISHFTHGYILDNELVFYIRGICASAASAASCPSAASAASAGSCLTHRLAAGIAHPAAPEAKAPTLRIMKWDPRFNLKGYWASNTKLQAQLLAPAPSEDERTARVAAAERNRKKKVDGSPSDWLTQ